MRRVLIWVVGALIIAIVGVAAYETWAVNRAWRNTPAILEHGRAQAGEPLAQELPQDWIDALLAVEDPSFRAHSGLDLSTPGQGLTTITQALAKRLYFDGFEPGFAKIEQSLIAHFVLDRAADKDEQLELFLGLAYFGTQEGREVIGFRDAAQTYFSRPLSELDRPEFLALVAMLIQPNGLRPDGQANAERVARIERLLAGACAPTGLRDVWLTACEP